MADIDDDGGVLEPAADQMMIVDSHNTAHILLPPAEHRGGVVTLCGGGYDLARLAHFFGILAAPWSLLTNPQYRAWPPWPCQTCLGTALRAAEAVSDG